MRSASRDAVLPRASKHPRLRAAEIALQACRERDVVVLHAEGLELTGQAYGCA
jgi:hypothetical protein